jgi:hypothetical protein
VLTDHPLKKVLFKPDTSGRLVNWAVELGEFDIEYLPRTAIKGQAMADFIAEFTNPDNQEDRPTDNLMEGLCRWFGNKEAKWSRCSTGSPRRSRN